MKYKHLNITPLCKTILVYTLQKLIKFLFISRQKYNFISFLAQLQISYKTDRQNIINLDLKNQLELTTNNLFLSLKSALNKSFLTAKHHFTKKIYTLAQNRHE